MTANYQKPIEWYFPTKRLIKYVTFISREEPFFNGLSAKDMVISNHHHARCVTCAQLRPTSARNRKSRDGDWLGVFLCKQKPRRLIVQWYVMPL